MHDLCAIKLILDKQYRIRETHIDPIHHGVINSNFQVKTSTGDYIFKIYNLRNPVEVEYELSILRHLEQKSFPCPRIVLTKDDSSYLNFSGKPCALFYYIPGRMLLDKNPEIMKKIGMLSGKLHSLLNEFPQTIHRVTWEPEDIRSHIETEKRQIIEKGFPDAREFITFISDEFGKIDFSNELPTGMTHQDIKPENIIVDQNGKISFIDFNDCYIGVLLYDIVTTVIWSCFENGILMVDLFISFVRGYQQSRTLSEKEKQHFRDALLFRLLREAFVWPMRFSPKIAIPFSRRFLLAYKNIVKNDKRFRNILESLWGYHT